MAETPLITFKAGQCDKVGNKIKPIPTPGYLYLFNDDGLLHFCWRPRSAPSTEPEIDLLMFPGDGTFSPVLKEQGAEDLHSPTNGRIYRLKFSSSGEKRYFWMQSKSQHKDGSESWFSQRDQRCGQVVDALLQGDEEIDVQAEVADMKRGGNGGAGGAAGEDDLMDLDDDEPEGRSTGAGGGASGAGEASRGSGAGGGASDADTAVQNFLNSLNQGGSGSTGEQQHQQQSQMDKPYTTLPDLLPSSTTIPFIRSASPATVDNLCSLLPAELLVLEQIPDSTIAGTTPTPTAHQAAIEALSQDQKKNVVERVLRSPQLHQSLGSLTVALRDGGLPMIGEALKLKVPNGGMVRGGVMPLGGGAAVEGFVEGVAATVKEEEKK